MGFAQNITGVSGQFTARHVDPHLNEGEHQHTWYVTAWYPSAPFRDARALRASLTMLLDAWHGSLMPPELWSAEQLAAAITRLLANCVGADVNRPDLGVFVQYRI